MGNRTSVRRRKNFRQEADLPGYAAEPDTFSYVRRAGFDRAAAYRRENTPPEPARYARPVATTRRERLGIDVPLLLVVCTLCMIGLLMVFSASWEYSLAVDGSPTRIFIRQFIFMAAGIGMAFGTAWIDYHRWQKFAVPLVLLTLGFLGSVLFFGELQLGAMRSLFGGSGGASVQPSELAKLVVIIYLAIWLYAKREQLSDITLGLFPLSVILGAFSGLIFMQPDLSAAVTIVVMGATLFFLAGGDWKQIVLLVGGIVLIGALVVAFSSTGSNRWETFVPGLMDPTQASYHVRRSFEAFVKGGWFGVGIGNADTKLTGLPVPHTDSIFAVVGEEFGVFGSSVLVLLYGVVLWRGLKIARQAPDGLGRLLAAGLSVWIAMEAFLNMAVLVGLFPFAGNALPFMSAGGSSLIVSLTAVGIIFSVSRQSEKSQLEEERIFNAVVDMRRRNGRWGESSSRRSRGARETGGSQTK